MGVNEGKGQAEVKYISSGLRVDHKLIQETDSEKSINKYKTQFKLSLNNKLRKPSINKSKSQTCSYDVLYIFF